jgi:leucyl-tRNA synthetase
MGYDSFGLPAEQYALETGQHPAVTTQQNIDTFRQQLENIGFSYDWSREVRTSDPGYYKWTQWIFLQIFKSWYDHQRQTARPIDELIGIFEKYGNKEDHGQREIDTIFSAEDWNHFSEKQQQDILMQYRLAYSAFGEVNWCEALGTVLANDEVVNGVSERGGHPVVKKKMRQWYMRITDYAERLLDGLEMVDFSEAMKDMQRNWIGRSEGAELGYEVSNRDNVGSEGKAYKLKVYTTRPDTIFGADFMVLAPEHELVDKIITEDQRESIDEYLNYVKSRSERERMAEVKQVTGCFTGAFALNPFDGTKIPIWIAEYVLAGYGTGAIMGVPCGDQRDFLFAKHFKIPITNIIGDSYNGEEANPTKEATLANSDFLNGIKMKDAIGIVNSKIEETGIGRRKVNYKMRDAGFSRQRYWGEPFPIIYKNGIAYPVDEKNLPVELPHVENYKPGPEGQGPLANIEEWVKVDEEISRETNTMPGYAGSSWYFLRYMDPHNDKEFASRKKLDYWNQVDVYIGGTEHAVGHLLYSRLWTKVLYDLGYIGFDEPFNKLINQGMIQGSSRFVYRILPTYMFESNESMDISDSKLSPIFITESFYRKYISGETRALDILLEVSEQTGINNSFITEHRENLLSKILTLRIDIDLVDGIELDIKAFRNSKKEYTNATFILEDGTVLFPGEDADKVSSKYICGVETEKMSKSKYNTVNPNELIDKYGADTFRMYEMFLGPVEQSKPWDTKGIEGVFRFLKKLWRLFFDDVKSRVWTDAPATEAELKALHRAIKKIGDDTERFSYNTAVSAFMVCVNELTELKCYKKEILGPLAILLSPYAPHIAEELYHQLGNTTSVVNAAYPEVNNKYLIETEKEYPVSINGKLRTTLHMPLDLDQPSVESLVLDNDVVQKWIEGKPVKKIIYVKGRMVNIVI